jgi:hypothetical protein
MWTMDISADRYVIGRENNVVLVDFTRPDPSAPHFPGAGALRSITESESESAGWLFEDVARQQRLVA